jgi:hypothetical protein
MITINITKVPYKKLSEMPTDKIQCTNEEKIVTEVNKHLGIESKSNDVFIFTEEEKIKIEDARLQTKNGQLLTHDEANKEIDEWLEK